MNSRKARRALKKIAKKEGTSVEAVRREIEVAIAAARSSPYPKAKAFWQSFPCKGDVPTPEEVIVRLAKQIK